MTVSFATSKADAALIQKIVARGFELAERHDMPINDDRLSVTMDITACHVNGNPLRLQELLDADDFNFAHDFFGIRRHLDRDTGKMTGFFSPRFTQRAAPKADPKIVASDEAALAAQIQRQGKGL